MYAVGTHQLSAVETVQHIHVIFFLVSFDVGLLKATSDRAIVVCNGEANQRTVWEVDGALYESFGKGASSDNDASVIVLDGTREDFGSRGSVAIYQNDHLVDVHLPFFCMIFVSASGAPFGVNNHFIVVKKLV